MQFAAASLEKKKPGFFRKTGFLPSVSTGLGS
jgi:hypothetical protein